MSTTLNLPWTISDQLLDLVNARSARDVVSPPDRELPVDSECVGKRPVADVPLELDLREDRILSTVLFPSMLEDRRGLVTLKPFTTQSSWMNSTELPLEVLAIVSSRSLLPLIVEPDVVLELDLLPQT